MDSFAQRLTALRESRELKKKDLAKILNVSNSCISQYESGINMPGHDILCRMSQYFRVSVDFLLGNDKITSELQLDEVFCGNTTYGALLTACSKLPDKSKQAVLAVIDALQENAK